MSFVFTQAKCPYARLYQSKEEGKDQESMQSSTRPDPGHKMEK